MPRQIQGSQVDFSFGEIDVALKRADGHPARKAGLRQMANSRLLNAGGLQNRSGRRVLYPGTNSPKRTERFTISPGNVYDIQFAAGRVKIINSAGTTVGSFTTQGNGAALPWVAGDLKNIVYAILDKSIYITFTGMRPQIISWDGVSTWSRVDYTEAVTQGGQKRTPFYRISPPNITLKPSGSIGNINVLFSSPIALAAMVGTYIRYCGRQLRLTLLNTPSSMQATVTEALPPSQIVAFSAVVGALSVGDAVIGSASGAKGIVTAVPTTQNITFSAATNPLTFQVGDAITGGTSGAIGTVTASFQPWAGAGDFTLYVSVYLGSATLFTTGETVTGPHGSAAAVTVSSAAGYNVQLIQSTTSTLRVFAAAEQMVGPSGSATISGVSTDVPQAVAVWEDEVMNSFRGYPASCFVDQFRVGFCNFPALPGGIAWSAINSATDLYPGVNPNEAIFEIAPNKVQIYYVVPGPEGSEFVFCDRRIYYIPISETNPLRPGSVAFKILSGDGAAQVQPRLAQEAILYVNAGGSSMMAIIATGAFLRPFNTKSLSSFHNHLFNSIQAIAAPSADGTFEERYAYVLNGDGSIAVGKYNSESLTGNAPVIGWGPWSGTGTINWIAAWAADVVFTSSYFASDVVEVLDDTKYLDCTLAVNSAPAAFAPPFGKGPLWFIPSQTVTLIDQGTRFMGTYVIDANGFIVPQFNGGEDLTRATLMAGQPWTMTVEPFAPDAQSGADMHQRMMRRRVSNFAAYVVNSTGFYFAKLFSRKETTTSPALGTLVAMKRIPAWNVGEDATLPPKQRETVESWRPSGHSFDPRVALIKDTPGPLKIVEIGMEVTL